MVRTKKVIHNIKTGEVKEEEFEFIPTTFVIEKGLDFAKLKKILVEKGIITSESEIE